MPNTPTRSSKSNAYPQWVPPDGFGYGFNPAKGTLTFYSPTSIRVYRANPPACWLKSDGHPSWMGSYGEGNFQIGELAKTAQRYRKQVIPQPGDAKPDTKPGLWAMTRFFELLDPELVALVDTLTHDSWLLYCMLWRAPATRDIARDNLGLAMLMATTRAHRRWRFDRINRLARKRRTEILAACELPAEKQWVKALRKIQPESIYSGTMHDLQMLARHQPERIELLRHLPAIQRGAIDVVASRFRDHVHPDLLRAVATSYAESYRSRWYGATVGRLLHDTGRMFETLGERLPLFRTKAQLQQAHDYGVEQTLARKQQRRGSFGPPPLPETEDIIALRSPQELHEEARQQHNCLAASYWADDCYDGRIYVYKVLAPERTSLAISREADGTWRAYEFKAVCNGLPGKAAKQAVSAWLRAGHTALAEGWRPDTGEEHVVQAARAPGLRLSAEIDESVEEAGAPIWDRGFDDVDLDGAIPF